MNNSRNKKTSPFSWIFFLAAFFITSCTTTDTARRNDDTGSVRAPSGEFRGAWVYDPRRFDPDDVVRELKEAGFNAVFVRLSSAGSAYYFSEVLPRAPGVKIDYAREYAKAGRKYGVQVHAWHVCFMMHYAPSSDVAAAIKKGEVMRDTRGNASRPSYNIPVRTPAVAANRLLERKAMLELATKYDLDGVQFDYIRYFSPKVDYSSAARAAFEEKSGIKIKRWPSDVVSGRHRSAYQQFKADLVTSVVRDVSQAVRAAKPSVRISAAVWNDPAVGLRDYSQDWVRWVRNGYLDFVVPMNYTSDPRALDRWISNQQDLVGERIPLYAGLGSYMLRTPGQLNQQIDLCRRNGLKGYVMYSYDEQARRNFLQFVSH